MRKLSLCIVLFLGLVLQTASHRTCQHHSEASQVIHKVPLEPKHRVTKRALDQPIRIREFYDSTVNSLEPSFQDLIKLNVVPKVIEFLSMSLQVRRTEVPILLSRSCVDGLQYVVSNTTYQHCSRGCAAQTMCGTSVIPEPHLQRCCESASVSTCDSTGTDGAGVDDADFVLYVSANSTGKCSQATSTDTTLIAFAGHCQQEAALDRPIAGSVNLCPDAIQSSDLDFVIATVKHELLHAMGFSSSLYAFFHDESMMPRTRRNETTGLPLVFVNGNYQPESSTVSVVTRNSWSTVSGNIAYNVNVMVTPAVQREARSHFNCSTLEGAELENQGGSATAVSHWEKRLFENEAMTGVFTSNPVFSRITLALLEDSGWYSVNYSMAGTLAWGRNLGCDFVFNSCRSWLLDQINNDRTLEPFCNIPRGSDNRNTVTDCTFDHLSVGVCNLIQFGGTLPTDFQYFDIQTLPSDVSISSPTAYGGNIQLADFCPYVQELTFTSNGVAQRETVCSNSSNQLSDLVNFGGEMYGTGSRCFLQGGPWSVAISGRRTTALTYGSGCYRYSCTQSGLKVEVQGAKFNCSCKGETLMIGVTNNALRYEGSIICPACSEVCWDNLSACPAQEPESCYGRITDTGRIVVASNNSNNNNNNNNGDGDGGAHGLHASLLSAIIVLFFGMTI